MNSEIAVFVKERQAKNGEPSADFINSFCGRHDVALPNDIFFGLYSDGFLGL